MPRMPRARDDPEQQHTTISATTSTPMRSTKPNAFDILMKPKMTTAPARKAGRGPRGNTWGLERLGGYVDAPETWPASVVVYYNDKWVVINDKYPKADVHLLILPRDATKNTLIPQDAFEDPVFLEECKQEEQKVRHMVAEQLRRKYGHLSTAEQARINAMRSDDPPDELPAGRDWNQMVISGIHARPSMKHLHIHVLSRDMVSDAVTKTDHYLSFTTDFLVGLEDFPLAREDIRRPHGFPPGHRDFQILRAQGMVCWRCGRNFQNKLKQLQAHLAIEFEEWKRE